MVLLLDSNLFHNKYNSNFFKDNYIIPINCSINIAKLPYYENSKYYYRNIQNHVDLDKFMQKSNKPKKIANNISQHFYNPKFGRGKIINYEYIPTKVEYYNRVAKNFYIKRIVLWTKDTLNDILLKVKITNSILSFKSYNINFLIISVKNKTYFNEYILLPKNKYIFLADREYYIDLSSILSKLDKSNFVIECSI